MSRSDMIAYQARHARATHYIRPDLIERIMNDEDGAILILADGTEVETNDKSFAIAERCRVVGSSVAQHGSRADSCPAEIPKHLTVEALTIKHPDGGGSIQMSASKNITGIWVTSADGKRFVSIQSNRNSGVDLEFMETALNRSCSAAFAISYDGGRPAIQVVRKDGTVALFDVDVLAELASKAVPVPESLPPIYRF